MPEKCDQKEGCGVIAVLKQHQKYSDKKIEELDRVTDKLITGIHDLDVTLGGFNVSVKNHSDMLERGAVKIDKLRTDVDTLKAKGTKPAVVSGGLTAGGITAVVIGLWEYFTRG